MDEFVPIPFHEYTSLNYFLQKNLGLLAILPKGIPKLEASTQTEPPTKEQSTQTKKPGLLWGYFS